jgi:hypothetical protein
LELSHSWRGEEEDLVDGTTEGKKFVDDDPNGKLPVMCHFYSKKEQKIRKGTYVIAHYR